MCIAHTRYPPFRCVVPDPCCLCVIFNRLRSVAFHYSPLCARLIYEAFHQMKSIFFICPALVSVGVFLYTADHAGTAGCRLYAIRNNSRRGTINGRFKPGPHSEFCYRRRLNAIHMCERVPCKRGIAGPMGKRTPSHKLLLYASENTRLALRPGRKTAYVRWPIISMVTNENPAGLN